MSLAFTSAMREATSTDSDPEFMARKRGKGQPPARFRPISFSRAWIRRYWLKLGVMTLAMTWGRLMASTTGDGTWPKPSIPYPPLSWRTAPLVVTIQGPRAARDT